MISNSLLKLRAYFLFTMYIILIASFFQLQIFFVSITTPKEPHPSNRSTSYPFFNKYSCEPKISSYLMFNSYYSESIAQIVLLSMRIVLYCCALFFSMFFLFYYFQLNGSSLDEIECWLQRGVGRDKLLDLCQKWK